MTVKFVIATEDDLCGISACADRFIEYGGYAEIGMPVNHADFQETVLKYIESDSGVVFVMKDGNKVVGGIAGSVEPWGFNHDVLIAVELFYWVDVEYRGLDSVILLQLYEQYMKLNGAAKIIMGTVNTPLQPSIEKLYRRNGYREHERFFIKDL